MAAFNSTGMTPEQIADQVAAEASNLQNHTQWVNLAVCTCIAAPVALASGSIAAAGVVGCVAGVCNLCLNAISHQNGEHTTQRLPGGRAITHTHGQ
jgi:hypothetical protein